MAPRLHRSLLAGLLGLPWTATAAMLTATLAPPSEPVPAPPFFMGSASSPQGVTLGVAPSYLTLNGKPWMPVMGEFHFTRMPEDQWSYALRQMKAGGIDIVATYVFWIHHEEDEGRWDWSGRRSLRRFVEAAREAGLYVVVRGGPWCHGEVRNGGLPEWLVHSGIKLRSEDPAYLERVRRLFAEIANQVQGLLWKDGGPVVAFQLENEYRGAGSHLLTLRQMAREAGIDVPYYTRTGWPALTEALPRGEILPLFGAYAEGFWDRELTPMPLHYEKGFRFSLNRTEAAIANEQLPPAQARGEEEARLHPYLTCEIGGGMMSSYHRRIRIEPAEVEATVWVKVGSGGNLPGYYMYQGGTNPRGLHLPLMETQDSSLTNWNDLPEWNYDFQAPLGQYHQVREHYHRLRRLHLFLRSYGEGLAGMAPVIPTSPGVSWAVRSDGRSGWVFLNHRVRGSVVPPQRIQFRIQGAGGEQVFPTQKFTVNDGALFHWPFNLALGHGVTLEHATLQPLSRLEAGSTVIHVMVATPGVEPELKFPGVPAVALQVPSGSVAWEQTTASGTVRIVLLSEEDSLALWRQPLPEGDRLLLSRHPLVFDGHRIGVTRLGSDASVVESLVPAASGVGTRAFAPLQGLVLPEAAPSRSLAWHPIKPAGPPRTILPGKAKQPVAARPSEQDFADAAGWTISLPPDVVASASGWVRITYQGDVLRVWAGDECLNDDFHHGRPFELAPAFHRAALERAGGVLRLEILPLPPRAPVLMPVTGASDGLAAEIFSVEWIQASVSSP